MRICHCVLFVIVLLSVACNSAHKPLTPAGAAEVDRAVRAFAQTVEHDVTQEGPTAWRRFFADSPSFFMASEGKLVFPDSATATAAIRNLPAIIQHLDLKWGNDLRVDPLAADLAVMGASYREIRISPKGERLDEGGFFTGTAEYRDGRWQFRNAHWSVAAPSPAGQ